MLLQHAKAFLRSSLAWQRYYKHAAEAALSIAAEVLHVTHGHTWLSCCPQAQAAVLKMESSPALSEPADAGAREPSSDEEWQQQRRRRVSSSGARSGRSTPLLFEYDSTTAAGRGASQTRSHPQSDLESRRRQSKEPF